MMILENKLGQKTNENEELQDHLTNALMRKSLKIVYIHVYMYMCVLVVCCMLYV